MEVKGKSYRTVWMEGSSVFMIDQTKLPFDFEIYEARTYQETCSAINDMKVRGAGAIGAAAGFAMAQAFWMREAWTWEYLEDGKRKIETTRPTAQNLFYATNWVYNAIRKANGYVRSHESILLVAVNHAQAIANQDVASCRKIGEVGAELIKDGMNIETHCNAGWLAFVDYGTALSPIYIAKKQGKKVLVYVDETRPRNQGALLTAWELQNEGIDYKIIPDNAGASLMAEGRVDIIIVGADRIALNGDVANKIGTLEKAICAKEFGIPFYVAAPISTFDLNCRTENDIPIEYRSPDEVLYQRGQTRDGKLETILVAAPGSTALNPGFDVTPAQYITGIITEKGIIEHPSEKQIREILGLA